jgi:hypothetical protein
MKLHEGDLRVSFKREGRGPSCRYVDTPLHALSVIKELKGRSVVYGILKLEVLENGNWKEWKGKYNLDIGEILQDLETVTIESGKTIEGFRVWQVQNPPSPARHFAVKTPLEGILKINELVGEDLKDPCVEANAFGLEVFIDGEFGWEEWYSEDVDDIMTIYHELS